MRAVVTCLTNDWSGGCTLHRATRVLVKKFQVEPGVKVLTGKKCWELVGGLWIQVNDDKVAVTA
jgi:hypothetical protein